ncbi:hypothetical protein QQX98_013385, partial [Neonectria punicea]
WQQQEGKGRKVPDRALAAIAGLPIHHGFRCQRCPDFLTINWKQCKTHCSQVHQAKDRQARSGLWRPVQAQTFFTQPSRRFFFPVDTAAAAAAAAALAPSPAPPPAPAPAPAPGTGTKTETEKQREAQLAASIQQQWDDERDQQQSMQLQMLEDSVSKHEVTNWLRRAGWIDHFSGKDLGPIYLASQMPGPEDDAALELMVEALDRLFFGRCIAGLQEMPLIGRL